MELNKLVFYWLKINYYINLGNYKPEELNVSPFYKMGLKKLKICKEYLRNNLHKGFIKPLFTP